MKNIIFHIDINSAFLSWEAVKQLKNGSRVDIRNIPSAIGGDREKRMGVILAKSIPAKRCGIKTGEPIAMALQKCPELVVFKPDFLLYESSSNAFMNICRQYSPVVEKYSIDECFVDMSGTDRIYPDIIKIANEIKDRIRDELGFTANIGISDTKILAKMASDFEKPDKVHTLFSSEIEEKMWHLPIGSLFSIGGSTAEKLRSVGIDTIGALAKLELRSVQALVGDKRGIQIHRYANGIDDSFVSDVPEEAKGYSISVTLEKDVTSEEEAEGVLLALADSVAARMRADKVQAYSVGVTIRYTNFKDRSHQKTLDIPTDITSEIFMVAKKLLLEFWDANTPIRLIGIALTNVVRENELQVSALDNSVQKERARKLDKTIDSIRSQYGRSKIVRGVSYNSSLRVGKKYAAQIENKEKNK